MNLFNGKLLQEIAQLKAALARHEDTYQALMQTTAVIEFDVSGKILSVNEQFARTVGYAVSDLIGQHHRLFCTPEYAASREYSQFWERLRRGEAFNGKFQRRKRHGEAVWLEATYTPVRGPDGKVHRVIKFAADVTAAVQAALHSERLIESLNRSTAMIEFDMQGQILDANAGFLSTMGYRLEEIRGQHHRVFCRDDYARSDDYRAFWARLNRGEFFAGRIERVARGGRTVWLEATYNPVSDEQGRPYRVFKFAADITQRVERAQAERRNGALAYDISRETETLSSSGEAVILGAVDRMNSLHGAVEGAASQVRELGEHTGRITSIVNTIQDIADQTNLLALNAAIEAARAGESGRGFAVVADEVRKLAERTRRSTTQIAEMVEQIQQGTQSVIERMGDSLSAVEEGVDLANQAGASIQRIRAGASRVVSVVQELAATDPS